MRSKYPSSDRPKADDASAFVTRAVQQVGEATARADELRGRLDAAETRAPRAERGVAELRLAEEQRKGQGRWRRAWRAWRGD
jgi:hypothetical protein